MNVKTLFQTLFLASLIILSACASDDDTNPAIPAEGEQIIIANEGGFLAVNAEVSAIDVETNTIRQNLYSESNDGAVLGDILQNIYQQGDELYLVMNNSSKIEVVGIKDFVAKRTIGGISSPNAMLFLSPTRAYVSDLFAPTLYEVNTQTGAITAEINLPASANQLFEVDGEVWCTSYFPGQAFVVNPATNSVVAEVDLRIGASGIVRDGQGKVWVLCEGNYFSPTTVASALYRINPSLRQIEEAFEFPESVAYGAKLASDPDAQTLYFVTASGLFAMVTSTNALPTTPFIAAADRNFYGINVDPLTGNLALTDARNFIESGVVYFYTPEGVLIQEFSTGINPDDVIWVR